MSDELKFLEKDIEYWEIQVMISPNLRTRNSLEEAKKKLGDHLSTISDDELLEKLLADKDKKRWMVDWCPRCTKHYKFLANCDDLFECKENCACSRCGLNRELDADKERVWPDEYRNIKELRHCEDVYLIEDYRRDYEKG